MNIEAALKKLEETRRMLRCDQRTRRHCTKIVLGVLLTPM